MEILWEKDGRRGGNCLPSLMPQCLMPIKRGLLSISKEALKQSYVVKRGFAHDRQKQGRRIANLVCWVTDRFSVHMSVSGRDFGCPHSVRPPGRRKARKSIGHASRVEVPITPMGCRPSPLPRIIHLIMGFVNEQFVNYGNRIFTHSQPCGASTARKRSRLVCFSRLSSKLSVSVTMVRAGVRTRTVTQCPAFTVRWEASALRIAPRGM